MRVYELVFIVKPDLPEEEVDATIAGVRETLEAGGATIDKEEKWGKRRLAYRVQRFEDGYYVLIQYSLEGDNALPKEVERRLRVADQVIKFMTVRIDEDLKRIEKAKKKRDKRTSRRPSSSPGRPSSGGGSGPAAPGLPSDDAKKPADDSKSDDAKAEEAASDDAKSDADGDSAAGDAKKETEEAQG